MDTLDLGLFMMFALYGGLIGSWIGYSECPHSGKKLRLYAFIGGVIGAVLIIVMGTLILSY